MAKIIRVLLLASFENPHTAIFLGLHSVIRNPCQLLLICVLLLDARVSTNKGFVSTVSVYVQNLKYHARF